MNTTTAAATAAAAELPEMLDKHFLPYLSTSLLRAMSVGLEYSIVTNWFLREVLVRVYAAFAAHNDNDEQGEYLRYLRRTFRDALSTGVSLSLPLPLPVILVFAICACISTVLLYRAVSAYRMYPRRNDRTRFLTPWLHPALFTHTTRIEYVRNEQGKLITHGVRVLQYTEWLCGPGGLPAGFNYVSAVEESTILSSKGEHVKTMTNTSAGILKNTYMYPLAALPTVHVCADTYGITFYSNSEEDLERLANLVLAYDIQYSAITYQGESDTMYARMPEFAVAIEFCIIRTRPRNMVLSWTRNQSWNQQRGSNGNQHSKTTNSSNGDDNEAAIYNDCCLQSGDYVLEVDENNHIVGLLSRPNTGEGSVVILTKQLLIRLQREFAGKRFVVYKKTLYVSSNDSGSSSKNWYTSNRAGELHVSLTFPCPGSAADVAQKAMWARNEDLERRHRNALFVFQLLCFEGNNPIFTKEVLSPAGDDTARFTCLDNMPMRDVWERARVGLERYRDCDGKFFRDRNMKRKVGVLLSGEPGTGKSELAVRMLKYAGVHVLCINAGTISTFEQWCAVMQLTTIQDVDVSGGKLGILLEELDVAPWAKPRAAAAAASSATGISISVDGTGDQFGPEDPQQIRQATNDNKTALSLLDDVKAALNTGRTAIIDRVLTDLDSIASRECIVIATTNHPEQIDPALKRPGRLMEYVTRRITRQECIDLYNELSDDKLPHPCPEDIPDMHYTVSAWVNDIIGGTAPPITPAPHCPIQTIGVRMT